LSFIGSMFSDSQGAGFQASSADVLKPATVDQANAQYGNAQNGLAQQNAFTQALQAQNGIGNQSSVFNQLQGVANGTGPNPAQAMLSQQTGANVANQAALMAGQRGAGSNVGLMARQAAQQGASTQQQAIGQAANMQANQSMNALNSMGSIAGQQVTNQAGSIGAYNSAAQGEQANVLNAIQGQNNANVSMMNGQNAANASIAGINAQNESKMVGGLTNGFGILGSMASGGVVGQDQVYTSAPVKKMADGGPVSSVGQYFHASSVNPGSGPTSSAISTPTLNWDQQSKKKSNGDQGDAEGQAQADSLDGMVGQDAGAPSIAGGAMDDAASSGIMDMGGAGAGGIGADIAFANKGGQLRQNYDTGGGVQVSSPSAAPAVNIPSAPAKKGSSPIMGMAKMALMAANKGGNISRDVPVMLSPGEKVLDPREAQAVVDGKEDIRKAGKIVPVKLKLKATVLKMTYTPLQPKRTVL
jgi:hypothetical protein